MRYVVVLTPEPDGSAWNVTIPALPGCLTWGEMPEDAIANAREAIAGHVAALRDLGNRFRPVMPRMTLRSAWRWRWRTQSPHRSNPTPSLEGQV